MERSEIRGAVSPADSEFRIALRSIRATKNEDSFQNAASAREFLRAAKHRADRRLARSRENPGAAVVDAAQERLSRQALPGQPELRRYRRAEMLQVDLGCRRGNRSRGRHHSGA